MCVYWLLMYSLIIDRCGPLGSHQASKKLDPPTLSLSCQDTAPHVLASMLPLKSRITHRCQREERLTERKVETEEGKTEGAGLGQRNSDHREVEAKKREEDAVRQATRGRIRLGEEIGGLCIV